jgi:DNA mismatch repair ATPase MutS
MADVLVGATKFKVGNMFTYPSIESFKEGQRPLLNIEGMVHPCIDRSKSVENEVNLGQHAEDQNLIITSPNSSGKSILIKSIIVNVVMAQTMGIACATHFELTPFKFINTQINVPDTTGHESLFEAEMHRCKHNLDALETLNGKGYSLIVMDEIFNSTNPLEAVAGAFAVCKKMAQYTNNILIFTTHYNYLTKLVKEKETRFANYRMETIVDGENIMFTYRFQKGVNKHLLALELLRKNGFENSIIDEAIAIKNSLMVAKEAKRT